MSTLAAFPADDPVWNTGGLNRTTPTTGKQALGWELGEPPPSGFFNWWMFYVHEYVQHYKVAAAALNTGKLDRDGGNTVTGNVLPDANATRDLGASGTRFDDVFCDGVNTNTLIVNTSVGSHLLPSSSFDLGSSGARWGDVFTERVDVNDMTINSSVVPDAAGGAFLGTDSLPWSAVVARAARIRTLSVYELDDVPNNQADLLKFSALTCILAACSQQDEGLGELLSTNHYNIASINHSPTGTYTVVLDQGVDSDAMPFVTGQLVAGTGDHMWSVSRTNATTYVVNCFNDAGGASTGAFSFMIIGRPTTVVDVIS